nr:hypothetical protein [Tanacetum cinerariifolium]
EEIDGGYVAFGGDPKGGKITGKDTECVVLSLNFKLLDESQVLLRVPRKNIMYSVDLRNVASSGGLTCLFAKATLDESNLWHRRLGHINFKTMNKLQNGVAERKNRTLIEAAKTMLADSKLPTTKLTLSFMGPFGCPVIILNTLDHLGKFDGKADKGFFVGYSTHSKAFRVFNTRTKIVEENLHITFLKNKPNVAGIGPNWMSDIDSLTMSMNYQPVFVGNQTNGNAVTKANIDAGQADKKTISGPQCILLTLLTSDSQDPKSSEDEVADDARKKSTEVLRKDNGVQDPTKEGHKNVQEKVVRDQEEAHRHQFEQESERLFVQGKAANTNSTNRLNTVSSPVNIVSSSLVTVDPGRERAQRNEFKSMFGQDKDANGKKIFTHLTAAGHTYVYLSRSIPVNATTLPNVDLPTDLLMPDLEDTGIFSDVYDDKVKGAEADFNNLELNIVVSPIPTTRIYKDHPKDQIIGYPLSALQTRKMTKTSQEHAMVSYIKKQRRTNHKDYQNCLLACFLSQIEPKKVIQALTDPSWIEAMQDELLQLKLQKMDVKSDFLYGTIKEEVPGFEDPYFSNKVYKVEKDLYGLHQAPKAWASRASRGEGTNENVKGVNVGVGGATDFSMIIAQQLQNLLPTILAQVGNLGNARNKNGNVVNENVQENIRNVLVNGNQVGCSYKEFLACNLKEYDGKGSVVVLTQWIEKMESVQDMSGCSINQKVKCTTDSFVGEAFTCWNSQICTLSQEVVVSMS